MKKFFIIITCAVVFLVLAEKGFCLEQSQVLDDAGRVESEAMREEGLFTIEKSYYPSGEIQSINAALNPFGKILVGYEENGSINMKIVTWKSGNSYTEIYNPQGFLEYVYDSTPEGDKGQKHFDAKGLRAEWKDEEIVYYDHDGKPIANGMCQALGKEGNTLWEVEIKEGKANGAGRSYDDKGNIISESFFKNGHLSGKQKRFSSDGKLIAEIDYPEEMSYFVSETMETEQGLADLKITDREGNCIGAIKTYDKNGQVVMQYGCDANGSPFMTKEEGFDGEAVYNARFGYRTDWDIPLIIRMVQRTVTGLPAAGTEKGQAGVN
ncbi:MAG TPA: hypothetical protein VLJ10_02970 [Candidatus Bathyarchaeia archaeon]|nr:hypothetical protein [Candidatus Bathyarchaeia archaeon]